MDHLRLGVLQYAPEFGDADRNLDTVQRMVESGPATDLLVLPEMSLTGFVMSPPKATLAKRHHAAMGALARNRGSAIVYGGVEDGFNRLFLVDHLGTIRDTYDKRHLFSLGHESETYQAGTRCPVWTLGTWRIRPAICYDLRFPYHFWKDAPDVDLALVSACWPASRESNWRALLLARAIENQVWVAGVNRIGEEPTLRYSGASLVLEPTGKPVLDLQDRHGVEVTVISHEANRLVRSRFPFLKDRLE